MSTSIVISDDLPVAVQKRYGETANQWTAMLDYFRMGPDRSLDGLCERYRNASGPVPTRRIGSLKEWSVKNDWQARLGAWIEYEQDLETDAWRERRDKLRRDDWDLGDRLRQRALDMMDEMSKFYRRTETWTTDPATGERVKVVFLALNGSPAQIAAMAKTASDIQRLAAEKPTDIADITLHGVALDTAIAAELAKLADRGKAALPGAFASAEFTE